MEQATNDGEQRDFSTKLSISATDPSTLEIGVHLSSGAFTDS
jgi:hypothetical protein